MLTLSELLISSFSEMSDPRWGPQKRHVFEDILCISLLAVMCGMETFEDMNEFGEARYEWLEQFLLLPHGVPSASTFRRVLTCLDSTEFERSLTEVTTKFAALLRSRDTKPSDEAPVVAIDGKAARRSFREVNEEGKRVGALHTVSAFNSQSGLVLGQVAVDEKSNEITAIPHLLSLIDVKGSIVTIDAMGCQKSISKEIRANGADYVLALKKNHGLLFKAVEKFFSGVLPLSESAAPHVHHEADKGHGRIEVRSCLSVESDILGVSLEEWEDIASLIVVEATREVRGRSCTTRRYYLSSLQADSSLANHAVRKHWSIENQLHWVLDVTFREDHSRGRTKNQQRNLAVLRRLATNILKTDKDKKLTMKRKRNRAALKPDYLAELLKQSSVLTT